MAAHSPSSTTPSEEFELETRFVVLSFLGLVPNSNALDQSFGSRGDSSSGSLHSRGGSGDTHDLTRLPEVSLKQKVDRLNEDSEEDFLEVHGRGVEDLQEDTVDTYPDIDRHVRQHSDGYRPFHPRDELHRFSKQPSVEHTKGETKRVIEHMLIKRKHSRGGSIHSPQRPNSIPVSSHYPSLPSHDWERPVLQRPDSRDTDTSEVTVPVSLVSNQSSYIDMQHVDLEPLVKTNALPPLVVPLKEELQHEWQDLEEDLQKVKASTPASSSHSTAATPAELSPEAEVAQYLSMLGDQVQEKYSAVLNKAFDTVMSRPDEDLTYSDLLVATEDLVGATRGWTKVSLILMLSKKLTYGMLSKGPHSLSKLTRYTTKLIGDTAAEFIIDKGGWHAITELEVESPMSPVSPGDVHMHFSETSPTTSPPEIPSTSTLTAAETTQGESEPEEPEELPSDVPSDVPADDDVPDAPGSPDEQMKKEVAKNVTGIRPQIELLRQRSCEYSRQLEEDRRRYLDEEAALVRRLHRVAAGLLLLGAAGAGLLLWLRYRRGS